MKTPLVSIIIPTYNRAQLLVRAIKSVLNQTYSNIEVIVVDDRSTDKTEKTVKQLIKIDSRLKYIKQPKNQGAPAARNRGISEAKGKYIGLLDDDDEYLKDKLKLQVEKYIKKPELGLVYGGFRVIREESDKEPVDKMPKYRGDISKSLLKNCHIGSPTVLISRKAFEKVGMFDLELQSCQDWDMWYRISKEFEIDYVSEVIAKYYLHASEQITTNWAKKVQGTERIFNKQRKDLREYPTIYTQRLKMLVKFNSTDGNQKKALKYHLVVLFKEPFLIRNWKLLLLLIFNFKRYQRRAQMA